MSTVYLGDCLDLLRSLPEASVDAIVTDPPYGIGFMGRAWDASVPGLEWAQECLRVLRPGGHMIAFGSTRTVHRLAVAIEDAGFEVRDSIGWVYYSGFPKSCDVSKQIDAAAGVERETVGMRSASNGLDGMNYRHGKRAINYSHDRDPVVAITAPATPAARQWSGWGTALKPAQEPAILARKPLSGTVAATVLQHGTGALNIDGCRFSPGDAAWVGPDEDPGVPQSSPGRRAGIVGRAWQGGGDDEHNHAAQALSIDRLRTMGRWPANLYACPKASRSERERGCDGLPPRSGAEAVDREEGSAGAQSPRAGAGRTAAEVRNSHPTVKPVRLMRWLCRLVTPPGGVVLDTFTGSGSTGVAAVLEGFRFVGSEREPDYHRIAVARIAHAQRYPEAWADTAPGRQDEAVEEVEVLERMGQGRLFGGGEE